MAEISYTKTNWVNNVTKLNADNMNHIEDGIEALDTALNTKASVDYVNKTHYGYSGDDLLIIPEGTTTIEAEAYGGTNYKCVVIPDSVTSIEAAAFNSCSNLRRVIIGNNVTNIGEYAFASCPLLTEINIGNHVTTIGSGAFQSCHSLTNITIPDTVTSIGDSAFYDCSSLRNIVIPKNITSINMQLFYHCSSLISISIPNSVTTINPEAFNGCSSLKDIKIPEGITTIEELTFNDCKSLTNIILPNSVTTIFANAFSGCSRLKSVTMGNNLTSIGEFAFSSCSSIESITIPDSVTSIGYGAFYSCPLTTIDLTAYTTQSFPTLGTDNFTAIASNCQIKVVKGRKAALVATSGWSSYANYVVEVPTVETLDSDKLDKTGGTITGNLSVDGNISATDGVMSASQVNTTNIYSDGNGGYVEGANIDVVNVKNLNIVEGGAGISFEGGKFISTTGDAELSSITTTGDVTVGGNLTVQGTNTIVDSTTLKVVDKLIEVAKDNTVPLTSPAGLVVPKYDGANYGALVYDSTGTAYVGDVVLDEDGNINTDMSNLQPLTTRGGDLYDGVIPMWSESDKTLNHSPLSAILENISVQQEDCSASGYRSFAIGSYTQASGQSSFALGDNTIANGDYQCVAGKYNVANTTSVRITGGGTSTVRNNIEELDWSGNLKLAGGLTLDMNGSASTITGISDSAGTSSTIAMSQKGVADAIAAAITSELTTEV